LSSICILLAPKSHGLRVKVTKAAFIKIWRVDVVDDLQALIDLGVVIGVGVEEPTSAALAGSDVAIFAGGEEGEEGEEESEEEHRCCANYDPKLVTWGCGGGSLSKQC
jgi:hypothetical protein